MLKFACKTFLWQIILQLLILLWSNWEAYNERSRNHVTVPYHVSCTFVETHPIIYEVLCYLIKHCVEIPQANHEWSLYLTQMLTK